MNNYIVEGAFWGRGKCPICERKYQKDMRLIWIWDKVNKKVIEMIKLCSWCFVIFFTDCLKEGIELNIEWKNKKEKLTKNIWSKLNE